MSTTSTNDGTASQPEVGRVTKTWSPPPLVSHLSLFVFVHNNPYRNLHSLLFLQGVRPAEGTVHEMEILFNNLPQAITDHLRRHFGSRLPDLCELYLQLGYVPEAIFADPCTGATCREEISNLPCSDSDIGMFSAFFGADEETSVTMTKRRGITGTLHRVSLITHPMKVPEKVLGIACRVGRAMEGLVETMAWKSFLVDMAQQKHSLVLIGKPGVGKTTCLREIARILSNDMTLNVVVVDKTCEIASLSCIGKARWMPVGKPNMQHTIMREAVENQTPDVIIVDEISTPQEVEAARTISQRGVQLIATVHGRTLPEVIMCKERGSLLGGMASVTLSGNEAERRFDKRKQVQKRAREPIFTTALELHSRSKWIFHPNVKDSIDAYLEGEPSDAQLLSPGKAIAVASIPGEGMFEYCIACGLKGTCAKHLGGHVDSATSNAGIPGFSETTSPPRPMYNTSTAYTANATSRPSVSVPQMPTPAYNGGGGGFSYSANGSTSRAGKSKGRRWRAPRGSGRCFRCKEQGHYARDCPNR